MRKKEKKMRKNLKQKFKNLKNIQKLTIQNHEMSEYQKKSMNTSVLGSVIVSK